MISSLLENVAGERRRICIVTPDVIGPINNGGIGTHVHYLARALASIHDVTVVFTGPIEHHDEAHWQKVYKSYGVEFLQLNEVREPVGSNAEWFVRRSYRIFQFLKDKQFDFIHFQDWQANGLHCIMAKQTTAYFQGTTLTVDMHSNTEWINDGMQQWNHWPLPDATLEWCERYCCQFADILISPSQYLMDYCKARGWVLASETRVLRNCFDETGIRQPYDATPGMLAFFGRLETRKGLELFLASLDQLSDTERQKIGKIYFLGKSGWLNGLGKTGKPAIEDAMKKLGVAFEVHTGFDAQKAIDFIREKRALAVIPSLVDNYPYTIVEALMCGIPLIASNAGGIPELLEEDRLFKPNARDLVAKLRAVLDGNFPSSPGHYNSTVAAAEWLALHAEPVRVGARQAAVEKVRSERPLVSICVPYYNYGQYLEPMVRSLQASTYENFEVVIVNDGSTDKASVEKFEELKASSTDARFNFLSKENGGIGTARNYAASHASGDFLIFCDADNCSTPEMIEEFLYAITMTGGDAVSCNYKAFKETVFWPDETTETEYTYLPIGAALEVGMLANVFGDANSIIRKSAFEAIDGFQTERHTSWEDWDMLARLCLSGHRLDVCPAELFWYRHTDAGFSRNTSFFQNHHRVLRAYAAYGPSYMGPLVRNVLVPLFHGMNREHDVANRSAQQLKPVRHLGLAILQVQKYVRRIWR